MIVVCMALFLVDISAAVELNQEEKELRKHWAYYHPDSSYRSWKEQFILRDLIEKGYNPQIRPWPKHANKTAVGGLPPVIVLTSLDLKSVSTVREVSMEFKAQFLFQQEWYDHRLSFSDGYFREFEYLHLSEDQYERIWIPDTFFQNEKSGRYHDLMQSNFYVMVRSDGKILYNRRLTMTFACFMNLVKYPLDTQMCDIQFASYAYTTKDIVYVWDEKPVHVTDSADSVLSNFIIKSFANGSCTSKTATGEYSCLKVDLELQRVFSFFLLQLYIPSSLLVAVSWISYWIDWRATAGRVPLAIVTLLTMITQSHAINANLPPVSYTKAVDVWVGACVLFIFGSLIEYAFVNYTGIREQRRHSKTTDNKAKRLWETVRRPRDQPPEASLPPPASGNSSLRRRFTRNRRDMYNEQFQVVHHPLLGVETSFSAQPTVSSMVPVHLDATTVHFEDMTENVDWIRLRTQRRVELFRWCNALQQRGRAERIDIISRVFVPTAFLLFNVVYWTVYW